MRLGETHCNAGLHTEYVGKALTRREAAAVWGISYSHAVKLDAQGLIRTIRIGRSKRVPPDEVRRVLEEGVRQ